MTISSINGTETLGVHMKINEIRHISMTVQNLIKMIKNLNMKLKCWFFYYKHKQCLVRYRYRKDIERYRKEKEDCPGIESKFIKLK